MNEQVGRTLNGQTGRGGDLDREAGAGTPFDALRSSRALTVLRERARRLAERPRSPTATATATAAARRGLIVVRCGSARYAFEPSCLAGVHRAPPIISLPDAPAPCLGVAVVRGRVHAVFDLGLSLGEPPATPAYLTLVNLQDGFVVAFAVAEIVGIEATRALAPAPADASTAIRGVSEDLTAVLDTAALLAIVGSATASGQDGAPPVGAIPGAEPPYADASSGEGAPR